MSQVNVEAMGLDRRVFAAGEVIFEEGDPSGVAFIIKTGSVQIVKRTQAENIVLTTLKASQAFGELSLIDNSPRSATAIAAEPTELMVVTADKFQARITGMDPFMKNWVLFLKHRILDLSGRVEE
jgi:CRP-like cAMP-binding protein